ncbi:MAG TPA: maleylpyruvate isomerase N-terminal domain-containing protein [Thermomicrobiales bacterium]|nr:maleylpyruvate isomerase N-terminal domain-containing protein [Thermomicrobiales bacterium]
MKHAQLLERLDRAWQAFLASYAGLPEARLTEPGVAGDWSVKDVIAHVTTWEEEALAHLPTILAGGAPPRYAAQYGGLDAFNALTAARWRDRPLADALRRQDEIHRRLIEFIQQAPDDQIATETRFRRRLRLDTYGHYPLHTAMIWAWREEPAAKECASNEKPSAQPSGSQI